MLRINNVLNNAILNTCYNDNLTINKPLIERMEESQRIRNKYPDRIPVVCDKIPHSTINSLKKKKFIVPKNLTSIQMSFIIRKQLDLTSNKGLFLFIDNIIANSMMTIGELDTHYRSEDGFLYIKYTDENVFG